MNNNEVIIIHENQTCLDDFLKDKNELCIGCRWCVVEKCLNSCCDEFDKDIVVMSLIKILKILI